MNEYKGISVSPGISVGSVHLFQEEKITIPKYGIAVGQVDREIERFVVAVENAIMEINQLKNKYSHQMGEQERKLLDSHILMLSDPIFKDDIGKKVGEKKVNVEWGLLQVIDDLITKINDSADEYIQARSIDFHDVSKRVLRHLLYSERVSLADLKDEVIIVAHNLLPSDAISMNKKMVKGIVMDLGSRTSHTAIIARSFNIPAVLGLSNITQHVENGDEIIVDGNTGTVIIAPDKATKSTYYSTQVQWHRHEKKMMDLRQIKAKTRDGHVVNLEANIEVAEEVKSVLEYGADGIGLFRSEFLFMQSTSIPSEEEQFRTYRSVLETMKDKSVTIRTLDLGGEKVFPGIDIEVEDNPILGWRAVRFCIAKPDFFKAQLRAILRASVFGNCRVMFPMISGIDEMLQTLDLLEQVKRDLRKQNIKFDENMPVGAMIEVPSAALTTDILARKVDFFSIGTNDLIQYTIAVDRSNEKIAYLYEPFHPGVLRLLKMIIDNAHAAGITVSMCGEMAGDPAATVVLLGLGLDHFSMSSYSIPEIKNIIRSVAIEDAKEMVEKIMTMSFTDEITDFVNNWMEAHLAKVFS